MTDNTPPLGASGEVTALLLQWRGGDDAALGRLLSLVYGALKAVAARQMRREAVGHTLEPTAVVHAAYLRPIGQQHANWQNRAQFFAISARVMRRVLVDHARQRGSKKRGGGAVRIELELAEPRLGPRDVDLLALDQALERLAAIDPQQVKVVELRFFAGLSVEETATALDISPATVKRDWSTAKLWLYRELAQHEAGDDTDVLAPPGR